MAKSGQLNNAEQDEDRQHDASRAASRRGRIQHAKAGPGRTRSIGTTLIGLLLVPLLALVGLWVFVAGSTLGSAFAERDENNLVSEATLSTYVLLGTIEDEREAAFQWMSTPGRPPASKLNASRATVNSAISAQSGTNDYGDPNDKREVLAALNLIPGIRSAVNARSVAPAVAFEDYSNVVDKLFAVFTTDGQSDNTLYQHTLGAIYTGRALEQLSREVAVVSAAQVNHNQLSPADVMLFAEAAGGQKLLVGDALEVADSSLGPGLRRLYDSPLHTQLASLESQFATSNGRPIPPRTLASWNQVTETFETKMTALATNDANPLAAEAGQVSNQLLLEAGLAGGLGLIAVVVAIILMVRVGRTIRRDLRGLHDGAQAMAGQRLPRVIERLRRGDTVDVAAESPPLAVGKITEVARVADAFSEVQRTAVDAAVGQANLRKAVNQVFLNLSLRNQSLLHRQLGMLDTMERATSDPDALDELFRLDHLTTRMRRHAENLIVLSGETPGRRWRDPVPVLDVLSAATAEVEDYTRVHTTSASTHLIAGPAATDVVHLIAELLENATSFSPPNSRVDVRAGDVGVGVALEIEDRGLGIAREELADINARLASPPEFDLADSDQLGLFVVGQLATRHGIKVSLRESAFGGTAAIVLLPHAILATADDVPKPLPRALPGGSPAAVAAPEDTPPTLTPTGFTPPGVIPPGVTPTRFTPAGLAPAGPPSPGPVPPGPAPAGLMPPRPGAATPAVTAPAPGPAGGGTQKLPRRVRQENMAPQLRGRVRAAPGTVPPAGPAAGRSPEDARNMFSSLQQGWQRGRVDDLDAPDAPDDPGLPGDQGRRPGDSPGGTSVWDRNGGTP